MTLYIIILFTLLFCSINAFKWHILDDLPPNEIITFSERYMFKSKEGPELLLQYNSIISIHANIDTIMSKNESSMISYAIFAAAEGHHHDSFEGMCTDNPFADNYWALKAVEKKVPTIYMGEKFIYDPDTDVNGTYYIWTATLSDIYIVEEAAWYNVAVQSCVNEDETIFGHIDGSITFRNPYGYIPAELWGFLPFELVRMIVYILFTAGFLYFYIKYNNSTMKLHSAILGVLFFATLESIVWYFAYRSLNIDGEPYCCPFPPLVVASLVLQIFRQTFARILLLTVSLGYGIVRPNLQSMEWMSVGVMSIVYFGSAAVSQVSEIVLINDVHNLDPLAAIPYEIPALFIDAILLTWIYLSLGSTIRILTEYQQTFKLMMYKRLFSVIITFSLLFAGVTVLSTMDKNDMIDWPWQYAWAQQVLWEILNFAVLIAVCAICRPSGNSNLLSYASQLPTDDYSDDDELDEGDVEMEPRNNNTKDNKNKVIIATKNPVREKKGERNQNNFGLNNFNTLPDAVDNDSGDDVF